MFQPHISYLTYSTSWIDCFEKGRDLRRFKRVSRGFIWGLGVYHWPIDLPSDSAVKGIVIKMVWKNDGWMIDVWKNNELRCIRPYLKKNQFWDFSYHEKAQIEFYNSMNHEPILI